MRTRARVDRRCEICGRGFAVQVNVARRGGGRFCSSPCRVRFVAARNTRTIDVACVVCGEAFPMQPSRAPSKRTCSAVCSSARKSALYRGAGNPFWKGGRRLAAQRRRQLRHQHDEHRLTWGARARVRALYGHRCARCGKPVRLTMDHVVPLSRGGCHVEGNLQPLCQSCNSLKGTRTIFFPPGLDGLGLEIDLQELVRAVSAGEAPLDLLIPAQCALNGLARSLKQAMRVPGVRSKNDPSTSTRVG